MAILCLITIEDDLYYFCRVCASETHSIQLEFFLRYISTLIVVQSRKSADKQLGAEEGRVGAGIARNLSRRQVSTVLCRKDEFSG